jgi:hypothetical protein
MPDGSRVITQTKRDTLALQVGGLGVRLTTPPRKKILLRNLKRRPRPTQGCRADDDDDDDLVDRRRFVLLEGFQASISSF